MSLMRAVAFAVLLAGSLGAQAADLSRVAWLSGDWRSESAQGVVEERWTAPAGAMMVGLSHAWRDGQTRSFEYLRLELRGTEVFYIASPNGKKVAEFKLVSATAEKLVFEGGDEHVQRVIYQREGAGKVLARSEGRQGGETFSDEVHYVRVPAVK